MTREEIYTNSALMDSDAEDLTSHQMNIITCMNYIQNAYAYL